MGSGAILCRINYSGANRFSFTSVEHFGFTLVFFAQKSVKVVQNLFFSGSGPIVYL